MITVSPSTQENIELSTRDAQLSRRAVSSIVTDPRKIRERTNDRGRAHSTLPHLIDRSQNTAIRHPTSNTILPKEAEPNPGCFYVCQAVG